MRTLLLVVASAAALTPTTRRAWTQSLAAGTASLATAATAAGPPGGFKDKPIEQRTEKVNINTSQAVAAAREVTVVRQALHLCVPPGLFLFC